MLEHVDLSLSVPKDEYKQRLEPLQQRLYGLQGLAYEKRVPTVIVFEGWAAAGKGSCINVLATRLDPRGFRVNSIQPPRTAELAYPWLHRFWLKVPSYGQMVVFDTSWYRRVLIDRIQGTVKRREWENGYQDIHDFEAQLAADGAVILKFWLHITKRDQARRFKKILADPLTAWQVSDEDQAQHKGYKAYREAVEQMLVRTEAPHAPWTIVPATDRYYTRLMVIETIVQALAFRLDSQAALHPAEALVSAASLPVPAVGALPAELAAPPPKKPEPAPPPAVSPATQAIQTLGAAAVADARAAADPDADSPAANPEDDHA